MNNQGLRYLSVGLRWKSFGAIAFLALTSLVMSTTKALAFVYPTPAPTSPPSLGTPGPGNFARLGVSPLDNALFSRVVDADVTTLPTSLDVLPLDNLKGSGGGNVADIFRAAADRWEQALKDDFVLTLKFGVANFSGEVPNSDGNANSPSLPFTGPTNIDGVLGLYIPDKVASDGSRETGGTILFNTDPSITYFLDPTPGQSQEYGQFSDENSDLGGGTVNVGRQATAISTSDASRRYDLYTVALHEIGNALAQSNANSSVAPEVDQDGNLNVTAPRPFAGTKIPITLSKYGFYPIDPNQFPNTVEAPQLSQGTRRQLSCIDALKVAEFGNFKDVDLDSGGVCDNQQSKPKSVPEPYSLASLFGVGVALVASRKRLGVKPLNAHL